MGNQSHLNQSAHGPVSGRRIIADDRAAAFAKAATAKLHADPRFRSVPRSERKTWHDDVRRAAIKRSQTGHAYGSGRSPVYKVIDKKTGAIRYETARGDEVTFATVPAFRVRPYIRPEDRRS